MRIKRIIACAIALLVFVVALAGCSQAGTTDKAPSTYKNTKWTNSDYSLWFSTQDSCKGGYRFNDVDYSVKITFDGTAIKVTDTSKNKTLFDGQWYFNQDDNLYVYDIVYNTKDYKDFKTNYNEFYTLKSEKLK